METKRTTASVRSHTDKTEDAFLHPEATMSLAFARHLFTESFHGRKDKMKGWPSHPPWTYFDPKMQVPLS